MTARMIVMAPTQDADSAAELALREGRIGKLLGGGPCQAPPSCFSLGAYQEVLRVTIGTLVRIINCMDKEDHLDRILAWESRLGFRGGDGVTPT